MQIKFNLWTVALIELGLISYKSARYARFEESGETIYLDLNFPVNKKHLAVRP